MQQITINFLTMNNHSYWIALLLLFFCLPSSAQTNSPNTPSEFTEKGKVSNNFIRPFKRVVYFGIDEIDLDTKAKIILDKLYDFLETNQKSQIEITGHSNGSCDTAFCEEIANQRAETVALYLFEKGLSPLRLKYNGVGKNKPAASNRSLEGRKKNQRVEIRVFTKR